MLQLNVCPWATSGSETHASMDQVCYGLSMHTQANFRLWLTRIKNKNNKKKPLLNLQGSIFHGFKEEIILAGDI